MDLELDDDQRALQEGVAALLAEHVDLARTTALAQGGGVDERLRAALSEAGFLDIALEEGAGWLDAVLLVEATARRGGLVDIGAAAIVAPALCGRSIAGPVALLQRDHRGATRFGAQARAVLIERTDEVVLIECSPSGDAVESNYGYPVGRLGAAVLEGASGELAVGPPERLRRFWRLALAAECVGTMRGAFETTVDYVKQRRQFGRAIGSFQAIQHRLAELSVAIEGARWLVYEASHYDAEPQRVATAAAHAMATAERCFAETHQLTGAMGYTREHSLHLWTMRLPLLRLELGGARAHRIAAARARWSATAAV